MDLHVVVVGELAAEHAIADLTCDPLCIPLLCRPVGHPLVCQQVTLNVEHLVASGLIFRSAVSFRLVFQAELVEYL